MVFVSLEAFLKRSEYVKQSICVQGKVLGRCRIGASGSERKKWRDMCVLCDALRIHKPQMLREVKHRWDHFDKDKI